MNKWQRPWKSGHKRYDRFILPRNQQRCPLTVLPLPYNTKLVIKTNYQNIKVQMLENDWECPQNTTMYLLFYLGIRQTQSNSCKFSSFNYISWDTLCNTQPSNTHTHTCANAMHCRCDTSNIKRSILARHIWYSHQLAWDWKG